MTAHCCDEMRHHVALACDMHPDRYDCGDCLIDYWASSERYGIMIHDGGASMIAIAFCPWCGSKLPDAGASSGQRMIDMDDSDGFERPEGRAAPAERIAAAFGRARAEGRAALITFVTAGDGDTDAILDGLVAGGADLIELGMPFTDPMADGPAIQAANLRSLAAGTRTVDVLGIAQAFADRHPDVPLILMGYANTMVRPYFAGWAAQAGVDGVIIVDVPAEENDALDEFRRRGLSIVRMATPTTDAARLPAVLEGAGGFLYYVSVAGITGKQQATATSIADAVASLKAATDLPVAVGFGIRTPDQAAAVAAAGADGIVIGSAIVELVGEHGAGAPAAVIRYIESIRAAL